MIVPAIPQREEEDDRERVCWDEGVRWSWLRAERDKLEQGQDAVPVAVSESAHARGHPRALEAVTRHRISVVANADCYRFLILSRSVTGRLNCSSSILVSWPQQPGSSRTLSLLSFPPFHSVRDPRGSPDSAYKFTAYLAMKGLKKTLVNIRCLFDRQNAL